MRRLWQDKRRRRVRVKVAHLEKIHEFLKVFADKCHHAKEEDVLFPEMEKAGVLRKGGPIGVMLAEHAQGREYVKNIGDGINKYKAGDKKAVSKNY